MDMVNVTLERFGDGIIPALFEDELNKVLENIDDPNTDPKSVRKITIELAFHPHENREAASLTVNVKSKLAHTKPESTSVFIGREKGRMVAYLRDPKQPDLPFDGKEPIPMEGGSES